VLTIGRERASTEPTVSISDVTITGGVNDSVPDRSVEFGGGISIPPAAGFTTGATVTVANSVVTGNSVAPHELIPPGDFCGPLPCAFAAGGGIDSNGTLTVTDSWITDNESGAGVAAGSFAGGIYNHSPGRLTMRRSFVTDNRTSVAAAHGQFASGGGILSAGVLSLADSVVSGNRVDVGSANEVESFANGGGIFVDVGTSATIAHTLVRGNRVTARNVAGDMLAFAGGIAGGDDGSFLLTDSVVDRNEVVASSSAAGSVVIAAEGGLQTGGVSTVRNSVIAHNSITADSPNGAALAAGAGIGNLGTLTVQRTVVTGNVARANGSSGELSGGGIFNFTLGGPDPRLTVADSAIVHNTLTASGGITPRGAGLFTSFPVTLTRTVIAGNVPDQCVGC